MHLGPGLASPRSSTSPGNTYDGGPAVRSAPTATSLSCAVPKLRSTRPFACGEPARITSTLQLAQPQSDDCVRPLPLPRPPLAEVAELPQHCPALPAPSMPHPLPPAPNRVQTRRDLQHPLPQRRRQRPVRRTPPQFVNDHAVPLRIPSPSTEHGPKEDISTWTRADISRLVRRGQLEGVSNRNRNVRG